MNDLLRTKINTMTMVKHVYVAHPIANDLRANVHKVLEIIKTLNLTDPSILAHAPYLVDCICMEDSIPKHRDIGMRKNKALLHSRFFDEIWLYGDCISDGMLLEIQIANKMNIKIVPKTRRCNEDLQQLVSLDRI